MKYILNAQNPTKEDQNQLPISLDDLKTADWSDIESGVYGTHEEVLEYLRILAFDPQSEDVFEDLFTAIYHQGDVYETTARAIPYLIEILRSEEVAHREFHARLLLAFAFFYGGGGVDYHLTPRGASHITTPVQTAITDGLADYSSKLLDSSADIRFAALLLLGAISERSAGILPDVYKHLDGTIEPMERAASIFCIGRLLSDNEKINFLSPFFRDEDEIKITRVLSALLLAESANSPLPSHIGGVPVAIPSPVRDESIAFLQRKLLSYGEDSFAQLEKDWNSVVCETEDLGLAIEMAIEDE